MTDLSPNQELRLHALEMARQHHQAFGAEGLADASQVVSTAATFLAFLKSGTAQPIGNAAFHGLPEDRYKEVLR